MRLVAFLLLLAPLLSTCTASRRPLQLVGAGDDQDNATAGSLAAELALVSARLQALALAADSGMFPFRRHRRHQRAAAGPQHLIQPVLKNVNTGLVNSTVLDFKGHRLTVVMLKNDEYVSGHIKNHNEPFQKELLGQLMDFVTPGSTVIDAGANMGLFSIFFAAATGAQGRVYSFEPQARMFQLLCTNMMVNSMFHVYPKNFALSHTRETLRMSAKVIDGTSSGMDYQKADGNINAPINYGGMRLGRDGEEVQAVTLDSFNLTNVSLLKVDVQGAEKLMFFGAQETIKRNLPVIAYESRETAMAAALEIDIKLPAAVRQFNIEAFLASLGYTSPAALEPHLVMGDSIMLPPSHPFLSSNAATTGALSTLEGKIQAVLKGGRGLLQWPQKA